MRVITEKDMYERKDRNKVSSVRASIVKNIEFNIDTILDKFFDGKYTKKAKDALMESEKKDLNKEIKKRCFFVEGQSTIYKLRHATRTVLLLEDEGSKKEDIKKSLAELKKKVENKDYDKFIGEYIVRARAENSKKIAEEPETSED